MSTTTYRVYRVTEPIDAIGANLGDYVLHRQTDDSWCIHRCLSPCDKHAVRLSENVELVSPREPYANRTSRTGPTRSKPVPLELVK